MQSHRQSLINSEIRVVMICHATRCAVCVPKALSVLCFSIVAGCHQHGDFRDEKSVRAINSPEEVPVVLTTSHDDSRLQMRERLQSGKVVVSADGTFGVTYVTLPSPPPMNELFDIELRIEMLDGHSHREVTLLVDADMPEHGHGMNVVPNIEDIGDSHYRVRSMLLHMPGRWEIYFDLARDGVTSRAQDDITLE